MNNLWQYRSRNLLSVTIISLSFLVVGVFFSLSNNFQFLARQLAENMVIVFFLKPDITPTELKQLEEQARAAPSVNQVRYVTREQAWERFRKNFPELEDVLKNLDANPFPASLEVTLEKGAFMSEDIVGLIDRVRLMPGVEDVQFNRDWVKRMQSLSRLARAIGFFLGSVLILASFFIISNVVRLNVLARKNEIEILRLVGATNTFIRLPFLLEGVTLGFLGSALSLLLLYLLIRLFPIYLGQSLGALQEIINFRYLTFSQSLGLILGSGLMGLLGSLSSLARFLKI